MGKRIFITDKEVAQIVGVSTSTITRICNGQFKGRKQRILLAKPDIVGGGRRWNINKVAEAMGISLEDIERIVE